MPATSAATLKPDATMFLSLIVVCVAYLLGSIPFGFLLVLLVNKEDIRAKGSGNIGATNVLRSGAKGLGILTFVLDGTKGYAAVAVADFLGRGKDSTTLTHLAILRTIYALVTLGCAGWAVTRPATNSPSECAYAAVRW